MNTVSEQQKQSVVREIEEAFRDTPRPVESNIVYDNSGKHLECNGIKATLKDTLWSDIPRDPSAHYSASVFFMTPEAKVYFLPGYMITCIEDDLQYESDSLAIETLLTPPGRSYEDSQSRFNSYVSLVTADQRRAICSYLELLVEKYPEEYPPDDEIRSTIDFWQDFGKR